MTILNHPDGQVEITELGEGRRKLVVRLNREDLHVVTPEWITTYPLALIEQILSIKGITLVGDEIRREEDPSYIQRGIERDILGYVDKEQFAGSRILDFGSGSGASTTIMARLFPGAEFVGVELVEEVIEIARSRAKWYGFDKVVYYHSPSGTTLPDGLGTFDYVTLNALYEHLLPEERPVILTAVWSLLKPGGILFLRETPYRYSPFESHTTGLPLINYIPDRWLLTLMRRLPQSITKIGYPDISWEELLREGIRGGTEKEIMGILHNTHSSPKLLEPIKPGINDRIDLWKDSKTGVKGQIVGTILKAIKKLTGITLVPYIALAIQKPLTSP